MFVRIFANKIPEKLTLERILDCYWESFYSENLFEGNVNGELYILQMPYFVNNEWKMMDIVKSKTTYSNYELTEEQFEFLKLKIIC